MKLSTLAVACALVATAAAQAAEFDFGTLSAGTGANAADTIGATFSYATLNQNTNIDGDPIAGSFSWQLDNSNGPVLVQDPSLRGHGNGPVALDAVDQPVAMVFAADVTLATFSFTIDHGTLFGAPIPHNLTFLDSANNVIQSTAVDYSVSGNTITANNIVGVREVILPSDRYIEKISVTAVPEIDGRMIAGVAALVAGWAVRRRKV